MGRKAEEDDEPESCRISAHKDLNEVWPEVIAEYEKVTEKKLDRNLTFAGFQLLINQRLSEATSKRSSNARAILNNVGLCLEQFGSIIAGGAGMVFGPSAQCWSAINFVLVAARKYSEVLDGFITLMERCAAFLSRLNLFLKQEQSKQGSYLPEHLRPPAYAILVHFINILKSSYKLSTSKKEKLKLVLDIVLFSGDAGVQSSLTLLEQQVQEFTQHQVDQILVDVRGLALHLNKSDEELRKHHTEIRKYLEEVCRVVEETRMISQQMKITLESRVTQEQNKENLESIRKSFGMRSSDEPWARRQDYLCKVRVQSCGRWLEDQRDLGFVAWADGQDDKSGIKVLTVQGDPGFGKTFISNRIVTYLQEKNQKDSNASHVSVAYYYYGDNTTTSHPHGGKAPSRKGDYNEKEESLEKCLRCIIYQFACCDPAYAKVVAEECQKSIGTAKGKDIWDRIIFKVESMMKGTYYICIDGLDDRNTVDDAAETMTTIIKQILSGFRRISIRLYISGTSEALKCVPEDTGVRQILLGSVQKLGHVAAATGSDDSDNSSDTAGDSISLINASDLEAVAKIRINEMGKKKPDLKTLMTEGRIKKLVASVNGNYALLETKFVQIDACDTEQSIHQIIESIGDDLTASIRDSLKVFGESLSTEQIHQVNELLIWIIGGKNTSIEFLQSALCLQFGKSFMLRDLIQTTYSGLLVLVDDSAAMKSEQAVDILRCGNDVHAEGSRSNTTATDFGQGEIDLCSQIIRNICENDVYQRFNFQDFFDSLAGRHSLPGRQRASIYVDNDKDLTVTITRALLQALCDSSKDENMEKIRRHASLYFYEYLHDFVEYIDFFEPKRESLTAIGSMLSQVFFKPAKVAELWVEHNKDFLRSDLLVNEVYIDSIWEILKNPYARMGYEGDVKKSKWIQSITTDRSNKYKILDKVASYMLRKGFTCKTLSKDFYLSFPAGVFLKQIGEFDSNPEHVLSRDQISKFINWTQEITNLDTGDAIFRSRVGAIYRTNGYHQEALDIFKEVESRLQDNWALSFRMAQTYLDMEDFRSALHCFQKVKSLFDSPTDDVQKFLWWNRILLPEANCHKELGDYDAALKGYCHLIEVTSQARMSQDALMALISLWTKTNDYKSIVQLFLYDKRKEKGTVSYFLDSCVGTQDNIHEHIINAAKYAGFVVEICDLYEEAINKTPDDDGVIDELENKEYLVFYRAALMIQCAGSDDTLDNALAGLNQLVLAPDEDPEASWGIAHKAMRLLARVLLDRGVDSVSVPEEFATENSYTARLSTLCKKVNDPAHHLTPFDSHNPRLCLVRLHLLRGDHDEADAQARIILRGVFDNWPEDTCDESLRMRYFVLAQILTIYNMDKDAMIAWQLLQPREFPGDFAKEENGTECTEFISQFTQSWLWGTDVMTSTAESELSDPALPSPRLSYKAYISEYFCDGCSLDWTEMLVDCWVCRSCLCCQLCTPCHKKLLADELGPLVCDKNHEFLYLPEFNKDLWTSVPDDQVLVDGKAMARDQWLDQFQMRWRVRQEHIDVDTLETARRLKEAVLIKSYILRWRKRIGKTKGD